MNRLLNAFFLLPLFSLNLASSYSAYGAVIYSQKTPSAPAGAFSSLDAPGGQKLADNFSLEGVERVTIRSVRFIGGYGVTSRPPITPPLDELPNDGFRIVFLEDNGGVPGTLVVGGDLAIDTVFRRAATGGKLLNGIITPIEFIINLHDGLTLTPSIEYWISISNNPGPDYGWIWARANGFHDEMIADTRGSVADGPWNSVGNGGMWFELNDHNIPEPSTLTFLLIGVFATAGCGGRS